MKFDNFEIHASPFITNAVCNKCGTGLEEVSNGWFSKAMYCPKCEGVFTIKLVKVPSKKVSKEFIEGCRKQVKKKNKRVKQEMEDA